MPVISISHHGGNVRASVCRPAAMEIMRLLPVAVTPPAMLSQLRGSGKRRIAVTANKLFSAGAG
jgi:hypothetical protein